MTGVLTLDVLRAEQPIGSFYVGAVNAYKLLEICRFDFRRIEQRGGYKDFLGIQRKLDPKRVTQIAQYLQTRDAVFPTSIVISVDARCATLVEHEVGYKLVLSEYVDSEDPNLRIDYEDIASIIDGQHRLAAFKEVRGLKFDLNVAVFIDVDDAVEAEIFSTVNKAQTKVNTSLVYDLFAVAKERSPERSCHEIVVALDNMPESPFFQRVKRLGVATEGRFGEVLTQANIVRGILPYITDDPLRDRDTGKRVGYWDPIDESEMHKRIFFPFFQQKEDQKILAVVLNFFNAVRERWPVAWAADGLGQILPRTTGFNGLIRYMRPAYLNFTTSPRVVGKDQFLDLLAKSSLKDSDFNRESFLPGSSGSSKLYKRLVDDTGLG